MGANGILRITSLWSHTNSANDKTLRAEFGGTQYYGASFTTVATSRMSRMPSPIAMRRTRRSAGPHRGHLQLGLDHRRLTTSSVDTSVDQDLVFSGQLANGGETITLESYLVELFHQA
jgi:hypothetical protein